MSSSHPTTQQQQQPPPKSSSSSSSSSSSNNNKKKKLMFLSESREISAYLNNYLCNNCHVNNTGDSGKSIELSTILKGLCEVKTQFANETNASNNKFVIV